MSEKVTILGAGESGTGAALLAKVKGYEVFVSDFGPVKAPYKKELENAGIAYEEGKHSLDRILNSGLIIKSPGIPESVEVIRAARAKGIHVIDEIEFASRFTSAKFIAITGTNGKTTTTLLTYHLLKEGGLNVGLAGNIGHSLAKQVIEDAYDCYVLELSSFQIDGTVTFKPHIAVLLNITPDHLDRYEYNLQHYVDSKFGLIKNMDSADHFIYFEDDALIRQEIARKNIAARKHPVSLVKKIGAYSDNGKMVFENGFDIAQKDTALKGDHNAVNMMAAVVSARMMGLQHEIITKGLKTFKNAPHRMEPAGSINGVRFFNDSKATNVDAAKFALESFSQPLIWIAGGIDKGNDYALIREAVKKNVKVLVCLGKDNSKLKDSFAGVVDKILETDNINDAVTQSFSNSESGDIVLLSPACASFDLFRNYEDRGDQFKQAVVALKEEIENKTLQ